MREQIKFDAGWKFRIGDEQLTECIYKGPVYSEAKTTVVFECQSTSTSGHPTPI